jgi:hypothetical protein
LQPRPSPFSGLIYFRGRTNSERNRRELLQQQERLTAVIEGTGGAIGSAWVPTIHVSELVADAGLHLIRPRAIAASDDPPKVDTVVASVSGTATTCTSWTSACATQTAGSG